MARAGSATVADATETKIFDDANGCSKFIVACLTASAVSALVRVPGLHGAGEYVTVEADQNVVFELGKLGIKEVFAAGNGGNATITYGVVGINL